MGIKRTKGITEVGILGIAAPSNDIHRPTEGIRTKGNRHHPFINFNTVNQFSRDITYLKRRSPTDRHPIHKSTYMLPCKTIEVNLALSSHTTRFAYLYPRGFGEHIGGIAIEVCELGGIYSSYIIGTLLHLLDGCYGRYRNACKSGDFFLHSHIEHHHRLCHGKGLLLCLIPHGLYRERIRCFSIRYR